MVCTGEICKLCIECLKCHRKNLYGGFGECRLKVERTCSLWRAVRKKDYRLQSRAEKQEPLDDIKDASSPAHIPPTNQAPLPVIPYTQPQGPSLCQWQHAPTSATPPFQHPTGHLQPSYQQLQGYNPSYTPWQQLNGGAWPMQHQFQVAPVPQYPYQSRVAQQSPPQLSSIPSITWFSPSMSGNSQYIPNPSYPMPAYGFPPPIYTPAPQQYSATIPPHWNQRHFTHRPSVSRGLSQPVSSQPPTAHESSPVVKDERAHPPNHLVQQPQDGQAQSQRAQTENAQNPSSTHHFQPADFHDSVQSMSPLEPAKPVQPSSLAPPRILMPKPQSSSKASFLAPDRSNSLQRSQADVTTPLCAATPGPSKHTLQRRNRKRAQARKAQAAQEGIAQFGQSNPVVPPQQIQFGDTDTAGIVPPPESQVPVTEAVEALNLGPTLPTATPLPQSAQPAHEKSPPLLPTETLDQIRAGVVVEKETPTQLARLTLGVNESATIDEIRTAYWAREYRMHPDRHRDRSPAFQRMSQYLLIKAQEAADHLGAFPEFDKGLGRDWRLFKEMEERGERFDFERVDLG